VNVFYVNSKLFLFTLGVLHLRQWSAYLSNVTNNVTNLPVPVTLNLHINFNVLLSPVKLIFQIIKKRKNWCYNDWK